MQFPKGAAVGSTWQHAFIGQGTPATITFDLQSYMVGDDPPAIPHTSGVYTLCAGTIVSLAPPVADFRILRSGSTNLTSVRRFIVTPAVSGRTMWDLDIHGQCVIVDPGVYTITPINTYLDCSVLVRGPGGSSGAVLYATANFTLNNAGVGTNSSLTGGAITPLIGGAGGATESLRHAGQGSAVSGNPAGGSAGTASGGDTNTPGEAGGSYPSTSNFGGASPGGGEQSPPNSISGNTSVDANPGEAPGGGASGARSLVYYQTNPSAPVVMQAAFAGGGGGGGVATRAFGPGVLLQGTQYILTVGNSGAAGYANSTQGGSRWGQGARGAAGQAIIE